MEQPERRPRLTTAEAAAALGVPPPVARHLLHAAHVPHARAGTILWDAEAVLDLARTLDEVRSEEASA